MVHQACHIPAGIAGFPILRRMCRRSRRDRLNMARLTTIRFWKSSTGRSAAEPFIADQQNVQALTDGDTFQTADACTGRASRRTAGTDMTLAMVSKRGCTPGRSALDSAARAIPEALESSVMPRVARPCHVGGLRGLIVTAQHDDQHRATLHVTPLRARPEALAHHEHAFADDRGTSSARRIVLRRVIGVPAACRIVLRRPVDHCSFRQGRSWPNEDRSWLQEDRSSSRDECSSSKEGCSSLRKHRSSLAKDCSLLFDRSLLISSRPVLAERGSFFVAGASFFLGEGSFFVVRSIAVRFGKACPGRTRIVLRCRRIVLRCGSI